MPAGSCTQHEHSGGAGAPPGPLGVPARSWLTLAGEFRPAEKAGPDADRPPQMSMRYRLEALSAFFDALSLRYLSACGAPRGARAVPPRIASYQFALFGAPSPSVGGSLFDIPSRDLAARR